jgi:TRAP transporter TAXI family solute receptor
MLKRLGLLALAGLLAVSVATAAQAQKKQIKMSTISPGSSMYLVMTTFANLVNQNQKDFEITVDATGAATKHMVDVARGSIDMSMTAPIAYSWMTKGVKMYKKLRGVKDLAKNLRIVFWFPLGGYHYTVYEDSGIKTLADLKGKKAFIGPPSGGQLVTGTAFIRALTGLGPKDYKSVNLSFSSALQAFQDRQIDLLTVGCLDPCAALQQLTATSKLRFLGVNTQPELSASPALKKFFGPLGRTEGVIKKGVYGENQVNEGDVWSNNAILGVTARAGLPEETVYNMTKLFWTNLEGIRSSAPYMKAVTLEFAAQKANMKFHPGAEKFYKEVGVWQPQ